jgi:lipopolysaccharide export system permease protein
MARIVRWALAAAVVALVTVVPFVHYRALYAHSKRLREVEPGRVYRSGQMNADGFRDARAQYGIRTVVCLRDDDPDPEVALAFLPGGGTVKESDLCAQLGMRFVFIAPDLVSRREAPARRPEAIDRFLGVMDDPDSYPVLIHCNAGLNRTGVLVAVYRMEYQGWTRAEAFQETLDNGFGRSQCTAANDYIKQYILTYESGKRQPEAVDQPGLLAPRAAGPRRGRAPAEPGAPREGKPMLKYIDWLLIKGYFKAYFVCLLSLLSLYIVIDLFMNLDEFTSHHKGLLAIAEHIASYYGYRLTKFFDQLCEPIVLMAAMFTVAMMQRSNELIPLLSAGVSTRRVVLPVLVSAWIMLSLAVANGELLIPRIAAKLSLEKDDPDGGKELSVHGAHEPNKILINGERGQRKGMVVRPFYCTIPGNVGGHLVEISAAEGRYIPKEAGEPLSGGWLLTRAVPEKLENWERTDVLEPIKGDFGKFFLHTQEVDFDALTRQAKWFQLASTTRLYEELQRPDTVRVPQMAVLFHMRLTRPILGMILVFMGLSVILTDQNRNVFISVGLCLVLCALFFAAIFASKQLGDTDILSPALAAWLPVLLFGPLAFVMFDAVHT